MGQPLICGEPKMIDDNNWKENSKSLLIEAFKNYRPRAEFIRKKKQAVKFSENEAFNIIGYKNIDLPLFENTWTENKAFSDLSNLFERLFHSVKKTEHAFSFITVSTDILNHKQCPSHLHNFLNKSPCRTTTFAIPVQVGRELPSFYISKVSQKWPAKWYLDYNLISREVDYEKIDVKKNKILKLQFNSSFHPHFITYTDSVVMWLVIDGADHDYDFERSEVEIDGLRSSS